MQSSVYADVKIWIRNEEERSCWRDGRGIGEIEEKTSKKISEMIGKKMGSRQIRWTCHVI